MKKLTSLLLALMMILGLSTTALAVSDTATLTIEDPYAASAISLFAESTTRTYDGYKLLNLTMGLKGDGHHPATCTGTHTDDCYNFAYTVNDVDADGTIAATGYRAILQAEVYNHAGDTFWGSDLKPANSGLVTDEQILEYLESLSGDNGEGVYGSLRIVADRLYRAIKTATPAISADKENMTGQQDEIDQGYWLIADVTGLDGHEANSLVILDTKGQSDINVTPKTAIPEVEKKVKDIEDSEDSNILDNAWQDSADHDIGDTVPFKLTGTLPSNAQYYTEYKMVFHDTLSAGLTLKPGTIKVLMYDTKYKADVDTDLNDFAKDVTDKFTPTTSGLTDGCTFEVSCDNVYTIAGVTKNTAFVVYYEATLNEGAVIGSAGNPNEVYLEFSNDPYSDGTGKTSPDKVIVFTYKLIVNKTDSHGHDLKGAGFTLSKKGQDGNYAVIGSELKGTDMTTFEWKGLDDGDYKLVETTVPDGYNKMDDIVFSISAAHSETAAEPELISLDGGLMGTGVVSTGAITKDIVNHTGVVLPETGAKGTAMLIGGSAMFVVVAAVFMVTRKKMSVYAD